LTAWTGAYTWRIMRGGIDFSSWQALLSTLVGLAVITLVAVGIRLLVMQTMQKRRERENRQINERLRTLIAAYKTLGGSFTGDLLVDPAHLRDLRSVQPPSATPNGPTDASALSAPAAPSARESPGGERRRRVRDAVEAALSDVLLLGTAEQVRLAAQAANDLVAGRKVETAALVISLRNFIREVLDLDPVPPGQLLPKQGPTRPGAAGSSRADRTERNRAGGGGGAGGGIGMGAAGLAAGLHAGQAPDTKEVDDVKPW
jgi:type II secretory pathway pseudopilin PulG